jgi:hypothetical protein
MELEAPGGNYERMEKMFMGLAGDFQRVRYEVPAWRLLVVAYRAATRRAKQQDFNDRRGRSGRRNAPSGRHHAAALGNDGGVDYSVGGSISQGGVSGVGFDDY